MKVLQYLDNTISNNLLEEQKENRRGRDLVQKLSGSTLGQPLQTQILHILGVPEKSQESYVLRKFQRGHHVEAYVMKHMPGLLTPAQILEFAKEKDAIADVDGEGQAVLTYRGATGHIDGIVDMAAWDEPHLGIIPHEVKSVTNAAFKWIVGGKAKKSHQLQAGMYAMALKVPFYMIHYVASDDYRIESMLFDTKDIAPEVDGIITEVAEQLEKGILPAFTPREDWQANKDYQNYPMWSDLTEEECMAKLSTEYPEAYKKLLTYRKGVN